MRLIIIRHGRTLENERGIIQGHLPGQLSGTGKEQAKKVADRLKGEHIDIIYSSDLARAADTAKAIAKNHPGTNIVFTKKLREKDHGDLQGKKSSGQIWPKRTPEEIMGYEGHGGETWNEVYKRAESFVHETLHKHKDDSVLFVSHGGLMRAMLCAIQGEPPISMQKIERMGNTSVSVFEIDEDKNHHIQCLNCTKHLD